MPLILKDGENVLIAEECVVNPAIIELDGATAVFRKKDGISWGVRNGNLLAILVEPARADRDDFAFVKLGFCRVRDEDSAGRLFQGLRARDEPSVEQRADRSDRSGHVADCVPM